MGIRKLLGAISLPSFFFLLFSLLCFYASTFLPPPFLFSFCLSFFPHSSHFNFSFPSAALVFSPPLFFIPSLHPFSPHLAKYFPLFSPLSLFLISSHPLSSSCLFLFFPFSLSSPFLFVFIIFYHLFNVSLLSFSS